MYIRSNSNLKNGIGLKLYTLNSGQANTLCLPNISMDMTLFFKKIRALKSTVSLTRRNFGSTMAFVVMILLQLKKKKKPIILITV